MPTHRIAYYADIHYKSDGAVDYWRPPANLDDAAVDLPSGLRVIGSTLWSFVDGEEAARVTAALAELGHEGVDMIRIGERLMTWNDATHLHLRARSYIEGQLYPRCANTHPRISSSAIRVSSRIRAPVKRSTASIRTSSRRRFWSSPSSE